MKSIIVLWMRVMLILAGSIYPSTLLFGKAGLPVGETLTKRSGGCYPEGSGRSIDDIKSLPARQPVQQYIWL